MPQATHTHTPNSVVIAFQLAAGGLTALPPGNGHLTYQDAILCEACRAAHVTHAAMMALSLSVADLPPSDPRHLAIGAAVARLREQWADEVEQAWTVPAAGSAGLREKAELLDSLIDRNADGSVPGSSALTLAASLAADVLRLHHAASA